MRYRSFVLLGFVFASSHVNGMECDVGQPLTQSFASGASWELCALQDDTHGLELRDIAYRAPGDSMRSVLRSLHLGEALLHYHEDETALSMLGASEFGGPKLIAHSASSCDGNTVSLSGSAEAQLCTAVQPAGILAKYGTRQALLADKWTLSAVSKFQSYNLNTGVAFFEDGRIRPMAELSGRLSRFTANPDYGSRVDSSNSFAARASLLYTWRVDVALNTDQSDDVIEELDYSVGFGESEQRPLAVTALLTETFRDVAREKYRGWRILDPTGSGYYLDPQDNGYSYISRQHNWAQFDLAITARDDCERHALNNESINTSSCGQSLDNFVNGQSLQGVSPVLWFSQTRVFNPRREDFPAISTLRSTFELLPFDWNSASPFEVPQ